jgi:hypothetical protein
MKIEEPVQQGRMIGLVEAIAADDQIKQPGLGQDLGPVTALEMR